MIERERHVSVFLTSSNVEPQIRRIQAAKKMLRALGGSDGNTKELMTVTYDSRK